MVRRHIWGILAVLASAGGAIAQEAQTSSEAQPQEQTEEALRDEARMHFERGNTLMEGENWEGALLEFERSLELFPTRSALFNLGMCQKALFKYVEAMQTFERFLSQYREQADPAQLQRVADVVEELRGLLAEVRVTVNVAGAQIFVDGEAVGTSPMIDPIQVVAGRHTIEARLEGYVSAQRQIPITSSDRITVELELLEQARVGGVRVEANVAEAEVFIDGDLMGTVPYRGVLQEGEHEIRVQAAGYETQVQTVAIATGDERIVTVALTEPSGADPAWFWSMVGLTGAAAVATAALGAVVIVKDDEYANDPDRTVEMQDEGNRLVIATDVCLGVTLAAAVAATVLAFTTDWGPDEEAPPDADAAPAASLAPSFGAIEGGGALFLVGRF